MTLERSKPTPDSVRLRKHCQKRRDAMLQVRARHEALFRKVGALVDPSRGRWSEADDNKSMERAYDRLINGRTTRAKNTMTAGFMSGHTSKSRPWFRISVQEPELAEMHEVRSWCDDVTNIIRDTLAKSNLYTALPNFYSERHVFGVATMACIEHPEEVVRFSVFTIGTYAVALDHTSRIDSFYRCYPLTAYQMQAKWPNTLPEKVLRAIDDGDGDQVFHIEQLIEPNPEARKGPQGPTTKAYRVLDWLKGCASDDGLLGYESDYENPILGSRWNPVDGQVYSTSPAIDALGDIAQLQHTESKKLKIMDLMAEPPLGMPDHLRGAKKALLPGAVTYITPMQTAQKVEPLYVPNANALKALQNEIQTLERRIDEAFFVDLFQMLGFLDDRQRTAYEISKRDEEKVAVLGPAIESLTDEVLDPIIVRTFAILWRRGMIPQPPEAMAGREIKVEYTSMMAQAQKATGVSGIERFLGVIGATAQAAGSQDIWDKVNLDEVADVVSDQLGTPTAIIVPDERVAEVRQARAQAQQQAQMAEQAKAMQAGAQAVKTAGEAVPQEGSVLQTLGIA